MEYELKHTFYADYQTVSVEKSNSSYGNWVVKTSEINFNFFWKRAQADDFARSYNLAMTENALN